MQFYNELFSHFCPFGQSAIMYNYYLTWSDRSKYGFSERNLTFNICSDTIFVRHEGAQGCNFPWLLASKLKLNASFPLPQSIKSKENGLPFLGSWRLFTFHPEGFVRSNWLLGSFELLSCWSRLQIVYPPVTFHPEGQTPTTRMMEGGTFWMEEEIYVLPIRL